MTVKGSSGGSSYGMFYTETYGADLTVKNLTVKDGGDSSCEYDWLCPRWIYGAGLTSEEAGNLTIINSVFENLGAADSGGAVSYYNRGAGVMTVERSVFRNNHVNYGVGGAISFLSGSNSVLTITDSLFENNSAFSGGAVHVDELSPPTTVTIKRSVFRNNQAKDLDSQQAFNGSGGAISTHGSTRPTVIIENSTFYNNSAVVRGGAMLLNHGNSNASITLKHVTIVGNTAPTNAGGGILVSGSSTRVKLHNTLIADNGLGKDCKGGAVNENVGSLSQDGSCANSLLTGDPKLGALQGSGANTHYPLTAGSPAKDAGVAAQCLDEDQLGRARPQGSACDIGAIQYYAPPPAERRRQAPAPTALPDAAPTLQAPPPAVLLNQAGYRITATHGLYSGVQCQRVGASGVGIQWVLDLGFIDAIDCWGYVEQGVEVCFPALGAVIFLDATTSPRTASDQYSAFTTAAGMTCVTINTPGTIVLVQEGAVPEAEPTDQPDSAVTALQDCMVTTLYSLHFRDGPGGDIIGGVGYDWTLTALARSEDWFQVDNNGVVGWISAQHVSAQGACE